MNKREWVGLTDEEIMDVFGVVCMNIVEAFAFLALFVCLYGGLMGIGFVVDKLLRRVFGRGIFPKDYFKL
jgi:hypothetical protein